MQAITDFKGNSLVKQVTLQRKSFEHALLYFCCAHEWFGLHETF